MELPNSWHHLLARRDMLKIGALGLAATVLPDHLTATAPRRCSADSVILLWMAGGVTHLDSFDPKPDAPEAVRGTLGTIATRLPGVRFAESMPEMAGQAH